MATLGIINGDMIGTPMEPSEHVDWNAPDYVDERDCAQLLGSSAEEFAASHPHCFVWVVEPVAPLGKGE